MHLVSLINNSGYWKMPYTFQCQAPQDGWGYALEANTAKKYNYVSSGSCDDNNILQIKFDSACQQIINFAKLDKEIFIWSKPNNDTPNNMVVQEVQLEDIKEPPKHKKKKSYLRIKIHLY